MMKKYFLIFTIQLMCLCSWAANSTIDYGEYSDFPSQLVPSPCLNSSRKEVTSKTAVDFKTYLRGVLFSEVGNNRNQAYYEALAMAAASMFKATLEASSEFNSAGKRNNRWLEITPDGVSIHHVIGIDAFQTWRNVPDSQLSDPLKDAVEATHTKNGKAYRLSPIMPERIEIYVRIMKEMEVRGLKPEV
jgi:hypothetical protein